MESMDNEIYASASEMNASPSASDMNEEMPPNPATENRLEVMLLYKLLTLNTPQFIKE